MVRVSPPSPSAASGELSELMFGRHDYVRYKNGLRACRGFIVMPEGPVTRLPGTKFLGETHNGADGRLTKFVFKDEDAVLLEWTDNLLRFWRNGSLVQSGGNPYSISTPYDVSQADKLQSLNSSDRIYLTEGSIAPHRLSRFALDNWTIEKTPFENGPFRSRNLDEAAEISVDGITGSISLTATTDIFDPLHVGVMFKLREIDTSDTPYWAADVKASVGDRVYYSGRIYQIVGFDAANNKTADTPPKITIDPDGNVLPITSYGSVKWVYVGAGNPGGVPNWEPNKTVVIGDRRYVDGQTVGGEAGTIEVAAFDLVNKTTGVNPPVHLDGRWLSEAGGPIWQHLSDGFGIIEITSVIDAQHATATVKKRLPDGLMTRPTYRWSEGAWSDLRGWPRAIGAYEQRHIYGGTPSDPRTIWHTVIGGTTDMNAAGLDDDGFSYILDSHRRDNGEIKNITGAGGVVHVGTTSGEFFGSATDADRAYSEATAKYESDTSFGSADVHPIVVDGTLVFLTKTLRNMVALLLNDRGRFEGEDLTQISRHILGIGCTKLVYQRHPIPIIWARLKDGDLAGLTFIQQQQVIGFHRHNLAGGHVVDLEVMPTEDGTSETLELIVRRKVGGIDKYYREQMQEPFVNLDGEMRQMQDAWHQFAAIRYLGAPADTIAGLDHLEGEAVTAWTEFGAFTDLQVVAGKVTLSRSVTSAIVGLDATDSQRIDTLDVVVGTPDGGDDGRLRTHRVTGMRVHRTAGGKFQVVKTRNGETKPSKPATIFNLNNFETPRLLDGVFEIGGHKGWAHEAFLRFTPEPGAPMTIVGRTPTIMVTDD